MAKKPRLAEVEEPFIVTAMLSLVGSTAWMWARHELFLQYFYSTELIALTHLLTLGFITSIMMGVLLRLAPMALAISARSRLLARVQFVLFVVGAGGMVFHFYVAGWVGLAWATLLVLAAAILQVVNFASLRAPVLRGDWPSRYVAASLVHLVLAAVLGALLGFDKGVSKSFSLFAAPFSSNLFAHAHLAAVGWVTTMIFGFQWKLVPTTAGDKRFWPLRFWLLQAGIAGLVVTWLGGLPGTAVFGALVAAAVLWQTWGPLRAFLVGRAREWELAPLLLLSLVALAGLALALDVPPPENPLRYRLQLAYGYTGLLGWVVLTVITMAFKLFPIWVWQERFQQDFGKKPVPGMKDLYSHRLRLVSNAAFIAGLLGTIAGILVESPALLAVFPGLVLLGVLAFAANFVRMARWALLDLEYRPGEEDWRKFREMFPGR